MAESKKLNFPRIKKVKLRRFSLFDQSDKIDETLIDGVSCIVGANGLGKSTFLTTINFALTGIVPEPNKPFKSIDEFYRHRLNFCEEYFEGRIEERDRDEAEIELEFTLGGSVFRIIRGLFEPDTLREFEINKGGSNKKYEQDKFNGDQIQEAFKEEIVKGIGIKSFEQFVFLQHYIFTFDESRQLVFWDTEVLQQCLYLVFGFDFETANKADLLNREIQKQDSLVRNTNYQASELKKTIEELKDSVEEASDNSKTEELLKENEEIENLIDEQEKRVEKLQTKMDDATLLFSEMNSKHSVLRNEYNIEFDQQLKTHSPLCKRRSKSVTV